MSWFSQENEDAAMKYCSILGAVAGIFLGFSFAGIGAAILFALLGALVGFFVGACVSAIFNKQAMTNAGTCLFAVVFIGGGIAIVVGAIVLLWGVGN